MKLYDVVKRIKSSKEPVELRRKVWINGADRLIQDQFCFFDEDLFHSDEELKGQFNFSSQEILADDWEYCMKKWVSK